VAASLIAFIVVYFTVFGAGTYYILRLMSRPPVPAEARLKDVSSGPVRAAGTTPVHGEMVRQGKD
jgi:cytochrome d ubiquinol oxidase subunit I